MYKTRSYEKKDHQKGLQTFLNIIHQVYFSQKNNITCIRYGFKFQKQEHKEGMQTSMKTKVDVFQPTRKFKCVKDGFKFKQNKRPS